MTGDEIVSKVRSIMNDLGEDESLTLLSEDTVKLEEYIKSAIPDAVLLVQQNSSVRSVNAKTYTATATADTSSGFVAVQVPDKYVRIIALKMSSWDKAVSETYAYGSEQYRRQSNEVTRSGAANPIVIEGYTSDGKRRLEMYDPTKNGKFDLFVYEAEYDPSEGLANLSANDPLAVAVCYMTASLVYRYFENTATAEELAKVSLSLIPSAETVNE